MFQYLQHECETYDRKIFYEPWACTIKFFTSIIAAVKYSAGMFVASLHFHPSLISVAYQSGALMCLHSNGEAPSLAHK
jgi:hypothetical protein